MGNRLCSGSQPGGLCPAFLLSVMFELVPLVQMQIPVQNLRAAEGERPREARPATQQKEWQSRGDKVACVRAGWSDVCVCACACLASRRRTALWCRLTFPRTAAIDLSVQRPGHLAHWMPKPLAERSCFHEKEEEGGKSQVDAPQRGTGLTGC